MLPNSFTKNKSSWSITPQKLWLAKWTTQFIILIVLMNIASAQPYLDIAFVKYTHSPNTGLLNRNNTFNKLTLLNAGLNIPIVFKKDSSILMFAPFAENWNLSAGNLSEITPNYYSLGLPVYFIKPVNHRWSITLAAIFRANGCHSSLFKNKMQIGGLFLNSFKKRDDLIFKIGLYYNKEFFGNFIVPLAGLDWKIDKKNSLFGVLPGNMIFERRVTNKFYYGASFKAITSSYMSAYINYGFVPMYIRIDDNQLGGFTDFYFAKNMALSLEAGHSIFRKIRVGRYGPAKNYFLSEKINNNLFIKLGLNYRMRFKGR